VAAVRRDGSCIIGKKGVRLTLPAVDADNERMAVAAGSREHLTIDGATNG